MFRLLGLLGGLAAVTDLGTGAPIEESLRRCVVATRLARAHGCDDLEVRRVLYAALLQHLGCTAYSHDLGVWFGDDIAATRWAFLVDPDRPSEVVTRWVPAVAAATGRSRVRVAASVVRAGRRVDAEGPPATCEVAQGAAERLGLDVGVQRALGHVTAAWNGHGFPSVRGDALPIEARVMHVASVAVMVALEADPATALGEVRRRSGRQLDPELVASLAPDLLDDVGEIDPYPAALAAEPDPVLRVDDDRLPVVAATFGDLVDLKSPWLHGHSSAVAHLAGVAGTALGLDEAHLRIAGHLHDVGRVAVSSRIWAREGRLSATEADQARLHVYHTERILDRVAELRPIATIAGRHHERNDGSGYHRGLHAGQLTLEDRVLAAADAYRCLVEDRPGRPGAPPDRAARRLQQECGDGALDGDAVAAVLTAAGHVGAVRQRPAGLTDRQLEVLRLAARGLSNREVAERLGISRRTAEHHVQDVYAKIGCSTRAGAALFAMRHGLVTPDSTGPADG